MSEKQRVTGFGGFFFRARDPAALAAWYEENLGIDPVPSDYDTAPWHQNEGPTVFAPFSHDTAYFGDGQIQDLHAEPAGGQSGKNGRPAARQWQ